MAATLDDAQAVHAFWREADSLDAAVAAMGACPAHYEWTALLAEAEESASTEQLAQAAQASAVASAWR